MTFAAKEQQELLKQSIKDLVSMPDCPELKSIANGLWMEKYVLCDNAIIPKLISHGIYTPLDDSDMPHTWEQLAKAAMNELYQFSRNFRPSNGRTSYHRYAARLKMLSGRLF